jgi:gliding motility-associated-like protein
MIKWNSAFAFLGIILSSWAHAQAVVGNFISNEPNSDQYLCPSESIIIQPLGGSVMPTQVVSPTSFNPGLGLAFFSCAPTGIGNPIDDPCFLGLVDAQALNPNWNPFVVVNNPLLINTVLATIPMNSPQTIFWSIVTMYDVNTMTVAIPENGFEVGMSPAQSLTLSPPVTTTVSEDCLNHSLSIALTQGDPSSWVNTYTVSTFLPANATYPSSIDNQTSINIQNLPNLSFYSFSFMDGMGCVVSQNPTFFYGTSQGNVQGQTQACVLDGDIVLNATPTGGMWSGSANTPDGIISPSAYINILTPTTISAVYTPNDAPLGCNIADTLLITLDPAVRAQLTAVSPLCANAAQIQLNADLPGGIWSGPNNSVNNQGVFNPQLATAGMASVTYAMPVYCGTTSVLQIEVLDLPHIQFDADVNQGCIPLDVTFTNTTAGLYSNVIWKTEGQIFSTNPNTADKNFPLPQCYNIELAMTNNLGCRDTLDSMQVICTFDLPWIAFNHFPLSATIADPAVQFYNLNPALASFAWSFAGEGGSADADPMHFFEARIPGDQLVCLTAIDTNGCENTGCDYVNLQSSFAIYSPNAFTPGEDGKNDGWRPELVSFREVKDYQVQIFNRYSEVVFESTDPLQYWDGNNHVTGQYVEDGTYYFTLVVWLYGLDNPSSTQGTITIFR